MKLKHNIYHNFVKRTIDFLLALIGIIVLSPILIIITILVRIKLGTPVIFRQKRPGKNEKIFEMYKFRTMTDAKDDMGNLLPDDVRLTSFGRKLRSTSLDELPELFNILKGDMAVVGPRPLAVVYLPYYTDEERVRHSIRPGLTGLAQVRGRNSLSWEEKFAYDIEYVKTTSILVDAKIIFKTFKKVIKRSDIGQGEEAPESLHISRGGK